MDKQFILIQYQNAIIARGSFENRVINHSSGDCYYNPDGTLHLPDYRQDLKDQYTRLESEVNKYRDLLRS
jgi:hypothetical protein